MFPNAITSINKNQHVSTDHRYTSVSLQMKSVYIKMDFRSKWNINIFICTSYPYSTYVIMLVEDTDNWTRSYILIIIYWNRPKVLVGKLKVGRPRLWCFFFKIQHRSPIRRIYHNICMLIPCNIFFYKM